MDDQTFRTAMGKFATGVTVVTTKHGEDVHGMTANAFMSVSLNPKLVLISIDEKATMIDFINRSGKFAVSILKEDQKDVSAYFAGQSNEAKEIEFNWFNDMPTIEESLATITCDVYDTVRAGDHTLYIGKVTDIALESGEPLAFYEGKYRQMSNIAGVN